ncbi:MAG: hypothetical protein JXB07_11050 [Anaerolineae bacterium]|nr:hypothetical protein [Anaerolineae bacterium]
MITTPDRPANGADAPCRPPDLHKNFRADVLQSLELSYDLLFDEARHRNAGVTRLISEAYIDDIENASIQSGLPRIGLMM